MWRFISALSVLFHWSICLTLWSSRSWSGLPGKQVSSSTCKLRRYQIAWRYSKMMVWSSYHSTCLVHSHGKDNHGCPYNCYPFPERICSWTEDDVWAGALWRNVHCGTWACVGATPDRRLGFVLEIARNMEECEVKDDMVENSIE